MRFNGLRRHQRHRGTLLCTTSPPPPPQKKLVLTSCQPLQELLGLMGVCASIAIYGDTVATLSIGCPDFKFVLFYHWRDPKFAFTSLTGAFEGFGSDLSLTDTAVIVGGTLTSTLYTVLGNKTSPSFYLDVQFPLYYTQQQQQHHNDPQLSY